MRRLSFYLSSEVLQTTDAVVRSGVWSKEFSDGDGCLAISFYIVFHSQDDPTQLSQEGLRATASNPKFAFRGNYVAKILVSDEIQSLRINELLK